MIQSLKTAMKRNIESVDMDRVPNITSFEVKAYL